ncbi:MAG: cell wall-binding repeat-containing protein, partial [Thermoactinomyces sp.]
MSKSMKWLALISGISIVVPFLGMGKAEASEKWLKRLGGANRYEVSVNISKELDSIVPDSNQIILARGDLYTDALSGGPLSYQQKSPILLTTTNSLPTNIEEEIRRRQPAKAVILGGTGSVSANVENQLKNMGISEVERIDGPNRFVVSANVADKVMAGSNSDTAIVASGLVFADALSATSAAAQKGMPILLVTKDKVPPEILQFIQTHPQIKKFIIVGGPGTVSETVSQQLSQFGAVDRISGANRYEVAVNTAKYFQMDVSTLVFARGDVFADALSGGPLAAFKGAPILLTPPDKLETSVQTFINSRTGQTDNIYLLGGTGSISESVEQLLSDHLKKEMKIIFSSFGDLYMMNPDGSNKVKLTTNTIFNELYGRVSPDGKKIVFMRDGNPGADFEIYVMNIDGTGLKQLTDNAVDDSYPDWSPDGSKIVFVRNVNQQKHIFVMNADGSNQVQYTPNADIDYAYGQPRWSMDGKSILVSADLPRGWDIIKADISSGKIDWNTTENLTKSENEKEYGVNWSSDGGKITFISEENNRPFINVMNSDGTERFKVDGSTGIFP